MILQKYAKSAACAKAIQIQIQIIWFMIIQSQNYVFFLSDLAHFVEYCGGNIQKTLVQFAREITRVCIILLQFF